MSLNDSFASGLTPEQYIATLTDHKDAFHTIENNFSVQSDDPFIKQLKDKNIRVISLAEPWCGHCMLNIPVLLNTAKTAGIDVRFLLRDENLDVMDKYLTNGNRVIPIFIFIDEAGNEVAQWGPLAPFTKSRTDELRKDLPAKDNPTYKEKFKVFATNLSKEFAENSDFANKVYEDIKHTVSKAL
ncbi:MAG TPA: thioredoxin family protein [Bacillota bacterium]|nr:thioredoxin family protein [Bacillota bacterium]